MKTRLAARLRRRRSNQNAVISTEAEVGQWAERSGETSRFSSGQVVRSANVMKLRTAFARRGKVRGFSTTLRPPFRLRFGRNDSCLGALRAGITAPLFSRRRTISR